MTAFDDEDADMQDLDKDSAISDSEYVKRFTKRVEELFLTERGREEARKQNLSDVKSTQIDNAVII